MYFSVSKLITFYNDQFSCLQAQNDEFAAIFNLEDYKGVLGYLYCLIESIV